MIILNFQAKLALTNRASAVIFDVSLDKNVSKLVCYLLKITYISSQAIFQ